MWWSKGNPRLGEEIRFHRDRLIEDYVAAGMDRAEAERRAFLEFGGMEQIEEACRDVRGRWREDLARDLQYALRSLRRNPGFSAVAVLSFALGIGANAAIFSVINAVMLQTLPVKAPERLVQITRLREGRPGLVSYPLFEHFRDNVRSISSAFAQGTFDQAIVMDGEDEFVTADLVSGGYFILLGIEPAAGRLLGPGDDTLSPSPPAAVISDRYWHRRFGRSPSAIGKSFTIRDRAFTIVGVTPPSYQGARPGRVPDLMVPLLMMMSDEQRHEVGFNSLHLLARLKPGQTVEQANAEVQVLYRSFLQSQAAGASEKERSDILHQRAAALSAPDGFNRIRDNLGPPLLILMGIVGLILMLACVNLSGLLLARAAARRREISIRLAIGAGPGRLVRQFLTESLVLAALGGGVGLALAGWFSPRLFTLFVEGRDIVLSVTPDWRVLAFTCAVSLLACCAAGLAPALQAVRVDVNPALKEVRAPGHRRLGNAFVVAQLAISMVLVVGATLFVGTLVKLHAVDRGFDSDGVLVVSVRTSRPYPVPRVKPVQAALLDRMRTMPGVRSASAAYILPVGGSLWDRTVRVEGYGFRPDESEQVGFNVIAPHYFATLGTPLLSGREFDERDTDTSPKVAIVNQRFSRYFFGEGSALGRRVTSVNVTYEIVGVVSDAKYQDLRAGIINTMYIPWTQREGEQPSSYSYLARAAAGDPMRLVPGLDRALREADPALRVRTARTYGAIVDQSIVMERTMATLGGLFGVLALLVAALGMFGVLSFQVARRTNELGVRMALGASRRTMMGLVLREVVVMVVAGVSLGAAGALVLTGLARKMLFGLTPTEPSVFAVAASVLAVAAALAGWLPARRASRVDPLVALRHE
ncbi:MAG TPA: ABC transporter permease [Vicinamibacteria bacterium]|nr:ABC transporter permease [Vicinamibacteria bacterium]